MNIQIRSGSKYSGKSSVAILTAASIYKIHNKEVVIVTNTLSDYEEYFDSVKNYKETLLINEQTIVGEIHLSDTGSNSDLKSMCINVAKGLYILPVTTKDAIEDLCYFKSRSKDIFLFDVNDILLDPKYLKGILLVFDSASKKIDELKEIYSVMTPTEKNRTILVCNKFMIGYDNQNKIIKRIGTKRSQVIFIKFLWELMVLGENKILDLVYKALDKDPDYVQYNQQLRELASYG